MCPIAARESDTEQSFRAEIEIIPTAPLSIATTYGYHCNTMQNPTYYSYSDPFRRCRSISFGSNVLFVLSHRVEQSLLQALLVWTRFKFSFVARQRCRWCASQTPQLLTLVWFRGGHGFAAQRPSNPNFNEVPQHTSELLSQRFAHNFTR